jgi:hypothetical protein
MSEKVILHSISNFESSNAVNIINSNFDKVARALRLHLSRSGAEPNAMLDELNMNGQRIENLGHPGQKNDAATKGYCDSLFTGTGDISFLTEDSIGVSIQAYDPDLDALAGKTAPSGDIVGTTDSQEITNKTIDLSENEIVGEVALSNGGTGASLVDPGADRILFWDDSAGQVSFLEAGTGLQISGTTMTGAGIVLLTSGTVSSQATLDIVLTGFTGYRALKFILSSFIPVTDDVELLMQFSTNGGSSYVSSGYRGVSKGLDTAGNAREIFSASASGIMIAGDTTATAGISNVANENGAHVEVTLLNQTAAAYSRVIFQNTYSMGANQLVGMSGAGDLTTAQDTDAVRFLMTSGNIASGKYAVYGLA